MRIKTIFILALALTLLLTVPVSASTAAQSRLFRQTHSIDIEVECIQAALDIIRELNGYNLELYTFQDTVWVGSWRSPRQRANIVRRVEPLFYRPVQEVLRGIGEVLNETEQAQSLAAQLLDVEARLTALSQEIDRLSLMLAASDSLDVLIAIDFRLNEVNMQHNSLMGTRNLLLSQAQSPVISIRLFEIPEGRPDPVPDSFGRRVADSFSSSWRGTVTFMGNFLVAMARISIPLVVWGIILGLPVVLIIKRRGRKPWKAKRQAAPEPEADTEAADTADDMPDWTKTDATPEASETAETEGEE